LQKRLAVTGTSAGRQRVSTSQAPWLDGVEFKDACFAGVRFPPHFHEQVSIGCVESGLESLASGSRRMVVPTGVTVVIGAGQVHAHSAVDDQAAWRYRALYLNPEVLLHRARRLGLLQPGPVCFPQTLLEDEVLRQLLRQLHDEPAQRSEARVVALVDRLLRHQLTGPPKDASPMDGVADFLRTQATSPLRLQALAARFHRSPRALVSAFRRRHGLSPRAFQLVHRINRSRALLRTGAPVSEVALDSGFYDQSHFVRFFKRYTGVAPSQFQRGCG